MVVRSIGVFSLGKVLAVIYGFFGLVVGGFFALASFFGAALGMAQGEGQAAFGMIFGGGAIIIMPVLYAFCGFLGGIITAALYNGAAALFGGIELELSGGPTGGQHPA